MERPRAVAYIRVSTDEQAREGISLDAQKAKITAYCELNDLDLIEIIEDAGKSGKDLNREGIQSLLDMVKARRIDAVVVYKLDRLSRRVKDTLTLMDLIEKKSVAFHSITERIDTKSAMGKFFLNIMASMNQWERDTISERTRDVLRHKRSKSEKTGGDVPFGFYLDGGRLMEDENEQKAIALVRDLRAKGYRLQAICWELEKEGYRTRRGNLKWQPKTISRIVERMAA